MKFWLFLLIGGLAFAPRSAEAQDGPDPEAHGEPGPSPDPQDAGQDGETDAGGDPVANPDAPAAIDDERQAPAGETDAAGARAARALFRQGVAFIDADDWSRATDRFRAALRLQTAPRTEFHLAKCLFELGQLNEAEELVVGILARASGDEGVSERLRGAAGALAHRIRAAGGELSIGLSEPAEDVQVFVDDRRVPPSRLEEIMTAALGSHWVEARRDGIVLDRQEPEVTHDARATVTLDITPPPLTGTAETSPHAAPDPDAGDETAAGDPSLLRDWRLWAAIGGGVIFIGAVITIIAIAAGSGGAPTPVGGNFTPGVLTWR